MVLASDFLELTHAPSIMPGESIPITVTLVEDCEVATYWLVVFSPSDLECLMESVESFKEWLQEQDWENMECEDLYSLIKARCGDGCEPDIAIARGLLDYKAITPNIPDSRTWEYPDFLELEWHEKVREINDLNTEEVGEYDVFLVGICFPECDPCECICKVDCNKFHTTFFTVPESIYGTITALIIPLSALILYSKKKTLPT
jgi:hypothetical protein